MPHAVDILRSRARSPLALLLALLLAGCGTEPAGGSVQEPVPGGEVIDAYMDARFAVMPDEAERRWEQIEFLPSYAVALKAASDQQKPLMLWVMNGHPLGCT